MDKIQKCLDALNKKGFHALSVPDKETAVEKVSEIIGKEETVGAGGSMTLEETGVVDALLRRGNTVYSSNVAKTTGMDKDEARKQAMIADVFLSSTNALTLEGDLINIDAIGNRVAGMFYGPDKVVIVTGRNKLTENPHTAIRRIKDVACPLNAKRLGLNTPCAITGKCNECSSPKRMCNVTVRIVYPPWGKQIHIIIIDGDYGF